MGVLGLTFLLVGADPDMGLAKTMLPIYQKEAADNPIVVERNQRCSS